MLRISFEDFIKYDNEEILKYYYSSNKVYLLNLLDLYKSVKYENDKEEVKEFLLKEMKKEFDKFQSETRKNSKYIHIDDFFDHFYMIMDGAFIHEDNEEEMNMEMQSVKHDYEKMKNRILELEFLIKEKEYEEVPF